MDVDEAPPGAGLAAGPTIGAASRQWTAELARNGIEGAAGDVRRLVSAVLGISAARALAEPERLLTRASAEWQAALEAAVCDLARDARSPAGYGDAGRGGT